MTQFKKGNRYWKLSSGFKGKCHTEESKRKMSESCKQSYRDGRIPPHLGKKRPTVAEKARQRWTNPEFRKGVVPKLAEQNRNRPESHRIKQSETRKRLFREGKLDEAKRKLIAAISGPKCIFWKGGISNRPYPPKFRGQLKDMIREMDNFKCCLCNMEQNGQKLSVHHIDYDKNNCSNDNLISLCKTCHSKTNLKRKYWMTYFNNKVAERKFSPFHGDKK